jgi:4,5-dihydroxyphthalate decarboxylase
LADKSPIKLTAAVRTYPHTEALKTGKIEVPGVTFDWQEINPQILAFRRMVRENAFDICELASTTYMIARAYGATFKALPVFFLRKFHHAGLLVREDAGIRVPKDLEGKKVGVRAYSVTTGAWTRGLLMSQYGLDNSKVTWVVDDEEHVTQFKLPPNVVHVEPGKSLASMMASGEIQAGFDANAGIGREGAPKEGWEAKERPKTAAYRELFEHPDILGADWYVRTGIYPMHGLLVIKDDIVAKNPWLPAALYKGFLAAKNIYVDALKAGTSKAKEAKEHTAMLKLMDDPLPYGIAANRPSIDALMSFALQMGLMPKPLPLDELFYDPEKF